MKRILMFFMAVAIICSCSSTGNVENGAEVETSTSVDVTGYTDIYSYIEGRYPGVYVENGQIHIRGAEEEPLFIVDGSRVINIDYINPNDVKSIEIVKGPDTAIYGVEGQNGVIKINLKKGPEL